ncbi:type VII secretion target [Stackebrandtia nassauensis]|uniref:Excreted virulence factor EspC, type VII ESX diderm n=1 Tax=Stackebrandtia nassauensis (strain DSM 44728 / CIP 108903 / NRRL B-16338 / NBRC 102104 / LLR-40K-21) TaxID=446470 RepID=D3Q789_STANL|nr:type VII secretion target [Stackebrandtia nassauensis]ADD42360.1 hypothetical protein Snas_2683 [Stackebrandtia nassauensis DSM 44728]
MNEPLNVVPSKMVAHGDNIAAIGGQMGTVADTANTVSAADGADAFGPLFAPFVVPLLSMAEEAAKGFINAAKETVGIQSQAVCGLAVTYTNTDQDGGQGIDQTSQGLSTNEITGAQS